MSRLLRTARLLLSPRALGPATVALPLVAFAVSTALLLVLFAGLQAFSAFPGDLAETYRVLALVGVGVLLVPFASLGGAAARLSSRRRDERLSTLRLLGATPRFVAALTVAEASATALLGALAGVVGYAALVPGLGLVHFREQPLTTTHLWLPTGAVVALAVGVVAVAGVSAFVGLRSVVVSPLGVRTRQRPAAIRRRRSVIGLGGFAALVGTASVASDFPGVASFVAVMLVFGAGTALLNVIGPVIVKQGARRQARRSGSAARLIAARTVLESPKAAWRQTSGVAVACFIAVLAGAAAALSRLGPATETAANHDSFVLNADLQTGSLLVLAFTFVMVACSIGVNQAADVLDRRAFSISLDRLGMPRQEIDRARALTVWIPLRRVAVVSLAIGGGLTSPLLGLAVVTAPVSLALVAGCVLAGFALVRLALRATRPLLLRVLDEPQRLG